MGSDSEKQKLYKGFMTGYEFKEYLDRTGALEALGNALERLSNEPELPENPREYIRKQLAMRCGAPLDPLVELEEVEEKLVQLKKKNQELSERLALKFGLEAEAKNPKKNLFPDKEAIEYNLD